MFGLLCWFTMLFTTAFAAPTEVRVYGLGTPRAVQAVARTTAGPVIASCNDAKKGSDAAVDGTWTCDPLALDTLAADILILADSTLLDAGRVKWADGETNPVALVRVQGLSVSISTDKKLPAARAGAVAAGPAATLIVRVLGYSGEGAPMVALGSSAGGQELSCRDDGRFPDRTMNDGQPTCLGAYLGLKTEVVIATGNGERVPFGTATWTGGAVRYLTLDVPTKRLSTRAFDLAFPGASSETAAKVTGTAVVHGKGTPTPTFVPKPIGEGAPTPTLVAKPTGAPTPTLVAKPTGAPTPTLVAKPTGAPTPTLVAKPTGAPTPTLVAKPTGAPTPTLVAKPTGASTPTLVAKPTGAPTPTLVAKPTGDGSAKPFVVPMGTGTPTATLVADPGVPTIVPKPTGDPGGTASVVPLGEGLPTPTIVATPESEGVPDAVPMPTELGPEATQKPTGSPKPTAMGAPQPQAGGGGKPHGSGTPHPQGPGGNDGAGGSKLWQLGPWMFAIAVFFGGISPVRAWLARPNSLSPNMRRHSPLLPIGRDPTLPGHGSIVSTRDGQGELVSLLDKFAPTTGVILAMPDGVAPPATRGGNVWVCTETEWDEVVECADALRRSGAGAVAVVVMGEGTLTDAGAVVPAPFERLTRAIEGWGTAILIAA